MAVAWRSRPTDELFCNMFRGIATRCHRHTAIVNTCMTLIDKIAVFIDESGDLNLETLGYYVACAVLVRSDQVESMSQAITAISNSQCNGAPLKSSRTGKNSRARSEILSEISKLPVKVFAVAVNKQEIDKSSGMKWRRSMYKFIQRILFKRIYQTNASVDISIDQFGKSDFMSSFQSYIDNHFEPTIFTESKLQYSSPDECVSIQAADFLAGSIRRYLEGKDDTQILSIVSNIILGLQIWPSSNSPINGFGDESELDNLIRTHCLKSAKTFLSETEDILLKSVCELLIHERTIGKDDFMYCDAMLKRLQDNGIVDSNKNKNWFMQQVIAPLRDSGVLIAACEDGYKIPNSREDVERFVRFVEMKTGPYLNRLSIMRESILLGTGMKYDLIKDSELLTKMLSTNLQTIKDSMSDR